MEPRLGLIMAMTFAFVAPTPPHLWANPSEGWDAAAAALKNPYANVGRVIRIRGILGQYLAPEKVYFSVQASFTGPLQPIILRTQRNLAETEAVAGAVTCVVVVQGATTIDTLSGEMEVPDVAEQECEVGPYQWLREETTLDDRETRLATKYSAHAAKDWIRSLMFTLNPFPWVGKHVFVYATYRKSISPHEAIIDVWPRKAFGRRGLSIPHSAVKVTTTTDLSKIGKIRCVVKVLGVTTLMPGRRQRPHVKEVECLP